MVRQHPLLWFMLVACGYSWTLWLLMIASSQGWLPFRFPTNFLGSFGPLIAALVLARPAAFADSARAFLRRTVFCRPSLRWSLIAVLSPLLLVALPVLAHALFEAPLPQPKQLAEAYLLPAVFVLILIVGGPLGEEFGWRGYVLPLLLRLHRPVVASLLLAGLWVIWHLPLFWLEGAAQSGTSIAGFALTTAAASVLFTWMYLRSGPGLWAVLLLHTAINVYTFLLPTVLPGVDESRAFGIALVAAFLAAAIAVATLDPRMRRSSADTAH